MSPSQSPRPDNVLINPRKVFQATFLRLRDYGYCKWQSHKNCILVDITTFSPTQNGINKVGNDTITIISKHLPIQFGTKTSPNHTSFASSYLKKLVSPSKAFISSSSICFQSLLLHLHFISHFTQLSDFWWQFWDNLQNEKCQITTTAHFNIYDRYKGYQRQLLPSPINQVCIYGCPHNYLHYYH